MGIARTLIRMEDYLLTEEQILLDPDYIYVDPEDYHPFLCLIPGRHGNFPEEFSRFLQYLLEKADHEDREAVVLIYGLYRESLKENYGLDNLLRWLMKENCPNLETTDGRGDCETIEKQKVEVWDSKEGSNQSETDISEKIPGHWYLAPSAVMFALAAASPLFPGRYGFMAYGIWLAGAGAGLLVIGAGLYIWSGRREPKAMLSRKASNSYISNSQFSYNQTSCSEPSDYQTNHIPTINPVPVQHVQKTQHEKPSENTYLQSSPWQVLFDENTESEPPEISEHLQPEPEEPNTVLLWSQEKEKKGYSLIGEDGSIIPLSYYPFIIGKQEGLCDHVISKSTVSRLHLRIDETEGGCQVTDLNSTNGTYINGRCLNANESAFVQAGDEIGIADLRFQLK